MLDTLLLVAVVLCLTVGQVLFKQTGLAIRGRSAVDALVTVATHPGFWLALGIYGFATLLWTWVLSRVPLSRAYPWVAVTTVLVPLLGWLAFSERVSPLFWVGMGLIVAGLLLTQLGSAP